MITMMKITGLIVFIAGMSAIAVRVLIWAIDVELDDNQEP